MSERKVYVIGAGLSGLAAAVALSGRGLKVEVMEAAVHAGGRCRSYIDPVLGQVIDNGNHLVLSGNRATLAYLETIGAKHALAGPERAEFSFADVRTGEQWTIRPSEGALPLWIFDPSRRVPQTHAMDYVGLAALMARNPGKRVGDVVSCAGPLWERLMHPLLLAALNTEPKEASATLASAVMRETLAKGGQAYRPRIATPTLSAAFIDPALAYLKDHRAAAHLGQRLQKLVFEGDKVAKIEISEEEVALGAQDTVILATPPWVTQGLVPDLIVPDAFCAIVNAHFRIATKGLAHMIGVIGGTAEWIFAFSDRISVTISGANAVVDEDRETLANKIWRDVAKVHGLSEAIPPWQIVKERRATIAATPEQMARRPKATTRWRNLFLAGDWTDTGLPATIEGAIRSGNTAAGLVLDEARL